MTTKTANRPDAQLATTVRLVDREPRAAESETPSWCYTSGLWVKASMDRIGKYEVLDKIGSGGFAVVYKGYDPFIKRPVAIKVCYSRDSETRERFYREAEIAGLLVHRNITTVYDFGLHDQTPYLIEEYLPGEDLAHMIRRHEPENLVEKLDFLVQIASGLGYAHSKGVIHRDVKPSNIRVLENGRVKIMDFGTAKFANVESNLTQTGMTLGTVAYLSPERLLGQPSGINSDLFSFGVLAYELTSYKRPFTGRNIPSLIDQVLNSSPVPLQESWPECPPELAAVVHRCLQKDPGQRYETCEPIKAELEKLLADQGAAVAASDSSTTIPQISIQLSGLLDRARQLFERGKYPRAEVLLDEVQATAAGTAEVDSGEMATSETAFTSSWETDDARRSRRVSEAVASINRYIDSRELIKAAEALRFATGFLGDFDGILKLRQRFGKALERELFEVRSAGLKQARKTVSMMGNLRHKNLLPLELAETFVDWVGELDPDDLAARHILDSVKRDVRQREVSRRSEISDRKKQEAVASIEKLLDEGNPAMADKALKFAVRLFGEFEQIPRLQNRISQALRQRT
jgi:serine/threonine-protein kinase